MSKLILHVKKEGDRDGLQASSVDRRQVIDSVLRDYEEEIARLKKQLEIATGGHLESQSTLSDRKPTRPNTPAAPTAPTGHPLQRRAHALVEERNRSLTASNDSHSSRPPESDDESGTQRSQHGEEMHHGDLHTYGVPLFEGVPNKLQLENQALKAQVHSLRLEVAKLQKDPVGVLVRSLRSQNEALAAETQRLHGALRKNDEYIEEVTRTLQAHIDRCQCGKAAPSPQRSGTSRAAPPLQGKASAPAASNTMRPSSPMSATGATGTPPSGFALPLPPSVIRVHAPGMPMEFGRATSPAPPPHLTTTTTTTTMSGSAAAPTYVMDSDDSEVLQPNEGSNDGVAAVTRGMEQIETETFATRMREDVVCTSTDTDGTRAAGRASEPALDRGGDVVREKPRSQSGTDQTTAQHASLADALRGNAGGQDGMCPHTAPMSFRPLRRHSPVSEEGAGSRSSSSDSDGAFQRNVAQRNGRDPPGNRHMPDFFKAQRKRTAHTANDGDDHVAKRPRLDDSLRAQPARDAKTDV